MLRLNSLNFEKKVVKLREKRRQKHTCVMFMSSRWTKLFSVCSGGGWRVMHRGEAYGTIDGFESGFCQTRFSSFLITYLIGKVEINCLTSDSQ